MVRVNVPLDLFYTKTKIIGSILSGSDAGTRIAGMGIVGLALPTLPVLVHGHTCVLVAFWPLGALSGLFKNLMCFLVFSFFFLPPHPLLPPTSGLHINHFLLVAITTGIGRFGTRLGNAAGFAPHLPLLHRQRVNCCVLLNNDEHLSAIFSATKRARHANSRDRR